MDSHKLELSRSSGQCAVSHGFWDVSSLYIPEDLLAILNKASNEVISAWDELQPPWNFVEGNQIA
jgi:hypothetical protein